MARVGERTADAPLPVPDGGWPRLLRRAVAVGALWAVAVFVIAAAALPLMDPQCTSTDTGRVCPSDLVPAISHLFDVRWPALPEAWVVPAVAVPMMCGVGTALFLGHDQPWAATGGAPAVVGELAGVVGAGVGLLIAGPGFVHPAIAAGITGLGALLVALGLLGLRGFRRALRRRHARHLRLTHLRAHGTRTVAAITQIDWRGGYRSGDPVLTVTARLGGSAGARETTARMAVARERAPIVGGTVIVIHEDEEGHPTGVDVLMEPDPHGARDPDARKKYPPAPSESPS